MQTFNILYDKLPEEWNGYHINTSFRVGVQLSIMMDDQELTDREKQYYMLLLLFGDNEGNIVAPESNEDIEECLKFLLSGWHHDRSPKEDKEDHKKYMDYFVDQGRIYADFMHFYGIDLNTASLHYWTFQYLLWGMPAEESSFLQVLSLRRKKPRKNASKEEIEAIKEAHEIYDLEQPKKQYSKEEKKKIDAYDKMRAKQKAKKKEGR